MSQNTFYEEKNQLTTNGPFLFQLYLLRVKTEI